MTDSMKFGPEWLRNMSAESATTSLNSGSNSSSTYATCSNSLGGNGSTSVGGGQQNNSNALSAPKNHFPEFRYGREEMLSLFDKNCGIPDILPSYKNIYVEKVQYPLALTPSTDEDLIPLGPTVPSQRPPWMQRSPVGFNSTIRGTGRGGSVDRGRMRGKPIYHPSYQRPTFDEDIRSTPSKNDRNWSERNGAGDGLGTEWSGTPTSSPRKEFSSHARNLENWRRNRNEEASGDASTGISSSEGWRGSSISTFGTSHRWGRSTSWRDEDISTGSMDNTFSTGMQRSYSTIATTVTERHSSRASNSLSGTSNGLQTSRNNQAWSSCGVTSGTGSSGVEGEDNLPEWAIENPSDSGGTFDASGAFHGLTEEDEQDEKNQEKLISDRSNHSQNNVGEKIQKKYQKNSSFEDDEEEKPTKLSKKHDAQSQKQPIEDNDEIIVDTSEKDNANVQTHDTKASVNDVCSSPNSIDKPLSEDTSSNKSIDENTSPTKQKNVTLSEKKIEEQEIRQIETCKSIMSDFSDQMREVAVDIEKLIMEDDGVETSQAKGIQAAPLSVQSNIESAKPTYTPQTLDIIMKQAVQQIVTASTGSPATVSPTLNVPMSASNHKSIPLFGGGMVIEHAGLAQHHHLQQQHMAAATAAAVLTPHTPINMNSTPSTDLWYYRDPQSKLQGPFTAVEMTEWYRAGYFDENLFVRRVCDNRFQPLGELTKICHGNMPFTHSHMIPVGFDNMHIPNVGSNVLKPQNEQREDHKGNVIATADTLNAAVKNLISPSDISHMLQLQFQILQDQYLQHQEAVIASDLMKNEWFQHLSPPERENLVRRKVQVMGLPDYLSSLSGLSNSLANLYPTGGSQLYDTIANYSKREHPYPTGNNSSHQQQIQHSNPNPSVNTFLEPDSFVLNPPQQQYDGLSFGPTLSGTSNANETTSASKASRNDDISTNPEIFNNFNMRMFLQGGNNSVQQKSLGTNFLNTVTNNSSDYITEQMSNVVRSTVPNQNAIMQMWIPTQQTPLVGQTQSQTPRHSLNTQWVSGPLGGIPNIVMESVPNTINPTQGTKLLPPSTMWDISSVDSNQQQQQQQNLHIEPTAGKRIENIVNNKNISNINPQSSSKTVKLENPPLTQDSGSLGGLVNELAVKESTTSANQVKQHKRDEVSEKHQTSNKRGNNKQQTVTKSKEDNLHNNCNTSSQNNLEDRRRETTDEKRRQKEERKRQQVLDEEKRLQQIEEEKRRQILEEKERLLQIQAQSRKALLGNNNGGNNIGSATNSASTSGTSTQLPNATIKGVKDQKAIKSSVAPWSSQTASAAGKNGPCLAEIQKAERRERRADQQRQMELMMRANAVAAAEINDSILTWNASPVPVKSFAEIQAEEAKRLADEQLELQRRKDAEQSLQNSSSLSNTGNNSSVSNFNNIGLNSSGSNISSIWGGAAKVWGSTSTAGFWEEPIKFSAAVSGTNNATTNVSLPSNNVKLNQKQQSSTTTSNQQASHGTRNLRKSQTVSVMQNPTNNSSVKNSKNQLQQAQINLKQNSNNNKNQNTKSDDSRKSKNIIGNGGPSSSSTTVAVNSSSKKDSLENEFNSWCIKSLNAMNTKVDVPTFVTFLQDLESPYEVKDYIRMYLGESKEFTDFAKQFLERRSKYKNLQRAQNAHNDDMCKPAPAITPNTDNSDNKGKQKKCKKNKMTKLDARILGFSVTAAEGRINVGDRDYVDAP